MQLQSMALSHAGRAADLQRAHVQFLQWQEAQFAHQSSHSRPCQLKDGVAPFVGFLSDIDLKQLTVWRMV